MITEREAEDILPPAGFIRAYYHHACRQTTAPSIYHLGVGLTILSATCPADYGMRFAGELRPNLFTLLIGRSGEDQKSTAISIGRDLLFHACPERVGDFPGSAEGLLDSLSRVPTQMIPISEFGKLLASAQRGYFEPIKTLLTDLWDCLDDETQVLTEKGWRGIDEVEVGDRVWSMNRETGRLELNPALDVGTREVRAGERMFMYESTRSNFRTTEGHDFYMRPDQAKHDLTKIKARDLSQRTDSFFLPVAGLTDTPFAGVSLSDDEIRYIAWTSATRLFQQSGETISHPVARTEDVAAIRALLGRLGFSFSEHVMHPRAGGESRQVFTIYRTGSPYPRIAELQDLTRQQFSLLWRTLVTANGTADEGASYGVWWTSSRETVDAISAMATLRGFAVTCSERALRSGNPLFRVNLRDTEWMQFHPTRCGGRLLLTESRPGERVWCVTTALGTLITRRKGNIVILGNCGSTQRAKANNKIVRIDNPRLSISGGCSIPYLEKHTLAEDWTGGFMGRWLVLHGYRERLDPDPVGDPTLRQPLIDWLARRIDKKAGWCIGLDSEARDLWNEWFNDVMGRNLPSTIVGIRSRAPTIARKVALLYGWDYGPASDGQQWMMSTRELLPAIQFIELHIKSLVSLSKVLAEHSDARIRRTVIEALRECDGAGTLGEVLLKTKMKKRPIAETLDALCEEGTVVRDQTAMGTVFRLTNPFGC
jgi:hypothetical protein